jgi:hypothetical protein
VSQLRAFGLFQGNFQFERVRGGSGRIRTSNQTVMSEAPNSGRSRKNCLGDCSGAARHDGGRPPQTPGLRLSGLAGGLPSMWGDEVRAAVTCGERNVVSICCSRATMGCCSLSLAQQWEGNMGRIIASFVVAASLLSVASSEASAWVCRAVGIGSGGWGRSYSVIDAKLIALRRCENYSPLPVCTILWCRPGG